VLSSYFEKKYIKGKLISESSSLLLSSLSLSSSLLLYPIKFVSLNLNSMCEDVLNLVVNDLFITLSKISGNIIVILSVFDKSDISLNSKSSSPSNIDICIPDPNLSVVLQLENITFSTFIIPSPLNSIYIELPLPVEK
jgi:hypothetical protein